MKLLIVVDKLLTGFDAPPATYLYIDKQMRDHGLFQAICRVNRMDGDDKEFGYIVDYKDLFRSLEARSRTTPRVRWTAMTREGRGGLAGKPPGKGQRAAGGRVGGGAGAVRASGAAKDHQAYFRYFSSREHGNTAQLKANEAAASGAVQARGVLDSGLGHIRQRDGGGRLFAVRCDGHPARGDLLRKPARRDQTAQRDAIDLKQYEPAMRHLIDSYIQAGESETVSAFEDLSLVELIVERGRRCAAGLARWHPQEQAAAAEAIENNVRRLILDESPSTPSTTTDVRAARCLIAQRKQDALDYQKYLQKIVELARQVKNGPDAGAYPKSIDSPGKRALFDNLDKDEALALTVDQAVRGNLQDGWRANKMKTRKVWLAISRGLGRPGRAHRQGRGPG